MNCRKVNSRLSDLLFDPQSVPAEVRSHVEGCAACERELAELRATMGLLDDWAVPQPNPFFDAKLLAKLREERQQASPSLLERWKARIVYGSGLRMQPLVAGALGLVLLLGGGAYADLAWHSHQRTEESAAVRDLESLDGNAQVFQQLDSVDAVAQQQNQDDGSAPPSSD